MALAKFFAELKQRNVYRAAALYAMGAWLVTQVATQVFPFFDISNSAVRGIIIMAIVGFPIAMVLAWIYDLTPEGIVPAEKGGPAARAGLRRKLNFIIIGVLLLVIAMLIYQRVPFRSAAGETIPKKSIAVLPFENYSADKANAFFASGIQDDILTNLARIRDLRVISRTSVEKYGGQHGPRSMREIATALGAANLLEGSVRREGNRVVVNVQLIDALQDRHLWANSYDRTLEDSLGLEGELAREIADALEATLTPEEAARVGQKPTTNAQANDLFLQARQYEFNPDTFLQDYLTADQLYAQAIGLDPKFAQAHARLAATRARIYHFYEPTDAWRKKARSEAETALQLQPGLGEAHHALGLCYYWFDRDYENALREFNIARNLSPNDSGIPFHIAAIKRRQGKWQETVADYRQILLLDPQNANIVRDLLYVYCAMRDWHNAKITSQRLLDLSPDSVNAKAQIGYVELWASGSTDRLKKELAGMAPGKDPDGAVTAYRVDVAVIDRDPGAAERALKSSTLDVFSYFNAVDTPRSFFAGQIASLRGDSATAKMEFGKARDILAASVREAPNAAERHSFLGMACAFAGDKEQAIAEGRKAVELRPESIDALDGATFNAVLAMIYARTGENAQALALLKHLLEVPGAVDSANYSITQTDLRLRWEWDPLRNDPEFQRLIGPQNR